MTDMASYTCITRLCMRSARNHFTKAACIQSKHIKQTLELSHLSKFTQFRTVTQRTYPYIDIPTREAAKGFVVQLDDNGRKLLMTELERLESEKNSEPGSPVVTRSQLKDVFLYEGIPFIGFGILDNMVMIVAGEYIDLYIGAFLGISTMAAAALGNLISDVAGVGTASYVELLGSKMGVHSPNITTAQSAHWKVRWTRSMARVVGISVGCIIGMFPLLFFEKEEDEDKEEKGTQT